MTMHAEREGVVVASVSAGQRARLRLQPSAACSGCGSRALCPADEAREQLVTVTLREAAAQGDRVRLALPESAIALAALLGYLLPAVCLLAGAVLFRPIAAGDAAPVLGAGLGLLAGLLLARWVSRWPMAGVFQPSVCSLPTHSTHLGKHS